MHSSHPYCEKYCTKLVQTSVTNFSLEGLFSLTGWYGRRQRESRRVSCEGEGGKTMDGGTVVKDGARDIGLNPNLILILFYSGTLKYTLLKVTFLMYGACNALVE